jgi:tetratricopeptide (TPR) repeat protein
MVVLLSRQKRFAEAHELLADVINGLDEPRGRTNETFKFDAEAELARAEERWDEAVSIYQTIVNIYRNRGHRWFLARYLIDMGDALLGRDGPGDHEQAQEAYRHSLEMFTEMDAPGYIQVLKQRLENM